jgi:hypothetical protein
VQVSLNGGPFVDAVLTPPGATSPTTVSYNLPVVPRTGSNTIQVRSIDHRNPPSSPVTRSFNVLRPLLVAVNIATYGDVTKGFSPSSFREVGKSYSITATPKAPTPTTIPPFDGGLFTGWTVSGATNAQIGIVESAKEKQTLTIIFREGMSLTANFVKSPFKAMSGDYNGLIQASSTEPNRAPPSQGSEDGTDPSNATEGRFKATVTSTGAFSGTLTIDGADFGVFGAFDANGDARFGTARLLTLTVPRTGKPSLLVSLHLDMVTPGINDKITGTVKATGFNQSVVTAVSNVNSDRAYYNGTSRMVDPYYLAASNLDGTFTAVFPAKSAASQTAGYTQVDYPAGDGTCTMTISKAGIIKLFGTLADGTAISASSALSQLNTFPLFAQLYNKLGFVGGFATLDRNQAASDLAATNLQWLRPSQNTHHYPHGWPVPIKVDLMGAKYLATGSVLKRPGGGALLVPDADGNVTLSFSDGQLTETLNKNANVSALNAVTKAPANDATFTLSINPVTGSFTGTILHTDDSKPAYNGIIYQKGAGAGGYGFFLTKPPLVIDYTGESGGVSLIGQ